MTVPTSELPLIATCAFGLEAIVRRELRTLGIEATIGPAPGRVSFEGDFETILRCNLWLRCADRVLIEVARFPAIDFDALFETTRSVSWGKHIAVDEAFPVTGRSIQSKLSSVPACQRSVKKAIVEALQRDHGTSMLNETAGMVKVDVMLLKDEASLTIDTTGPSLHRRGYRVAVSKAPLKETLAAALVALSYWKPERMLLDPFCGSGTILIEAAMLGRGIAPGLTREFAFETWQGYQPQQLADLRSTARSQSRGQLPVRLIGRDVDRRALASARENAARAGVSDDIHFETGNFRDLTSSKRFGCLITNPPYGLRIGDDANRSRARPDSALEDLYASMPELFRHLPTWSIYVLTAFPGFEAAMGRQADRRRKLYNGRIECTYFQFHGPKPIQEIRGTKTTASSDESGDDAGTSPVVLVHAEGDAAFGELNAKAEHQGQLFATRLRKRARHLRRWPTRRGITCYRLYERDIPEIPLVVDRYEDHLHITEYERPHERDPATHANWLDKMARMAGEALDVPAQNVHLKSRRRQRGSLQHERLGDLGAMTAVNEGGLQFLINLDDYVDTGLFLDHRITRSLFREEAQGKDVLNLFAYTGSFSVYAAAGGAKSTTSVDLSRNYLDWAWQNMRLNGFTGHEHRFVATDTVSYVRDTKGDEQFDLVIVDPPTFSNSKRTDEDWNVQRDAVPLLKGIASRLRADGVLFFSNNFRRFKLDVAELPEFDVREISRQTVPEDFRNRRIHRCWRMQKKN
ncbi:MAG: bifunctional 23S rRNA (guanine(2069)-N(7))-methyltransferase RlmK/23S rRNA (guanine(2445)-N(2))-methyltransferase RlmL [Planctomycetota bacterium]